MHVVIGFAIVSLLIGCPAPLVQDAVADFDRGQKNVILQIGSGPGGGYEVVGRAVAAVEPITGEALDALTRRLVTLPADVAGRARRLLNPESPK